MRTLYRDAAVRKDKIVDAISLKLGCLDGWLPEAADAVGYLLQNAPGNESKPSPMSPAAHANGAKDIPRINDPNHVLAISAADIVTGTAKMYSIQGVSGHNHTLALTAAHFTMLKQGQTVVITSGVGGNHTHSVSVKCG